MKHSAAPLAAQPDDEPLVVAESAAPAEAGLPDPAAAIASLVSWHSNPGGRVGAAASAIARAGAIRSQIA